MVSCPTCDTTLQNGVCSDCTFPQISQTQQHILLSLLFGDGVTQETHSGRQRLVVEADEHTILFLSSALAEFTDKEASSDKRWVSLSESSIHDYLSAMDITEIDFDELSLLPKLRRQLYGLYGQLESVNGSVRVAFNPVVFSVSEDVICELLRDYAPIQLPSTSSGEDLIYLSDTKAFFDGQLSIPHPCVVHEDNWPYPCQIVSVEDSMIECDMCGRTVEPWSHYSHSHHCDYPQVTLDDVYTVASCFVLQGDIMRTPVGCGVIVDKEHMPSELIQLVQNLPYDITESDGSYQIGPDGRLTWLMNWTVNESPFGGTVTDDQAEVFVSIPEEFKHNPHFSDAVWSALEQKVTLDGDTVTITDIEHMLEKPMIGEVLGMDNIEIVAPDGVKGTIERNTFTQ